MIDFRRWTVGSGLWVAAFLPWGDFVAQKGLPADRAKAEVRLAKTSACDSGPIFKTKVAASGASRSKGYGGRKTPLSRSEGMLFVYPAPEVMSFWMKDVAVPLAIGFYDVKGNFIRRHLMPPEADPAHPVKIYDSGLPVQVALETAPEHIPAAGILCLRLR